MVANTKKNGFSILEFCFFFFFSIENMCNVCAFHRYFVHKLIFVVDSFIHFTLRITLFSLYRLKNNTKLFVIALAIALLVWSSIDFIASGIEDMFCYVHKRQKKKNEVANNRHKIKNIFANKIRVSATNRNSIYSPNYSAIIIATKLNKKEGIFVVYTHFQIKHNK